MVAVLSSSFTQALGARHTKSGHYLTQQHIAVGGRESITHTEGIRVAIMEDRTEHSTPWSRHVRRGSRTRGRAVLVTSHLHNSQLLWLGLLVTH